jgi:MFS family permease
MTVYLVVALSMLNSIGQRGAKVAIALYALELGAGAAAVGVLAALFAVFPLLLAVQAGRISDRFGVRVPIVCGTLTMAAGLILALATEQIAWLFLCPALIGLGHIFFHVSIHNLVGSLGADAARTRNFSTFALGSSIAAFIGPSLAGFAIELAGFRSAFAILAVVAAAPAFYVLIHKSLIPSRLRHEEEDHAKSAFDLLAIPALRRTLIMSGVTLTGIELFSFYLPIYGRSIGLAPSVIGMVLSSYAVAGFIVRSFMHRLASLHRGRRSDWLPVHRRPRLFRRTAPRRRLAPRRGSVRTRARARVGAAADHHPHLQPRAGRPLRRGARHAHHGEQGDPDRGAARLRRLRRRLGRRPGVPRHRSLPARRWLDIAEAVNFTHMEEPRS